MITFLALFIVFYSIQPLFVFTPVTYRNDEELQSYEKLSILTDDRVELEGVCYSPKNFNSNVTILFFAGRSHDAVGLMPKLAQTYPFAQIITFNYRSYGRSGGKISERIFLKDSLKIATLVQKNYGDFYLMGFSLGSVAASYVASQQRVLGVILIGTFDSFANLVKEKFKISLSWLLCYKLNVVEYVKHIDSKTYVYASRDDETTYIQNVRNLVQSVQNLVEYKEYDNLSHKELPWDEEVVNSIRRVLEER